MIHLLMPDTAVVDDDAEAVGRDKRGLAALQADEHACKDRARVVSCGSAGDLPDGRAFYDHLARQYTTTPLGAEQIHAIGLKEVARIRAEMAKGTDPTSEPVRALARKWASLVREFTGGDPGIEKSLQRMWQEETTIHGVDTAEMRRLGEYIGKALAAFQETLVTGRTAFDEFRDALAGAPDDPQMRHALGIALLESGDLESAKAEFRRALDKQPGYGEAHRDLGIALGRQGDLRTAIASLERAVELLPRDSGSHWNLGTFLRRAGRGPEGAEHLRIDLSDQVLHLVCAFEDRRTDHGDRAVMLGAGDLTPAMLAGDEAALAVAGVAVGMVRWFAEDADLAGFLVPFEDAVVRDVAPEQEAAIAEPHRALAPPEPRAETLDLGEVEAVPREGRIEDPDPRVRIALARLPVPGHARGEGDRGGPADARAAGGDDAAVRVILLTGAGEKAFIAGADVSELHALATSGALGGRGALPTLILGLGKPVIAAVNGVAAGAGAVIALAADLRLAAEEATFRFLFTNVGLAGADMGCAYLLPRLVGLGRATELLLLGDRVDAGQAAALGLANRVVDDDQLPAATAELARRLADGPALAYASTKVLLARELDLPLAGALELEAVTQALLLGSEDHREFYAAFTQGRSPTWKGR